MDLLQGRLLLILLYVVPFVLPSTTSETIRRSPFVCVNDICNRNTTVQYCDLRIEFCKACDDVRDDCFTVQMQENCTDFCHVQDCPALSGIVHGDYNVTGPVHHGDIVGVNCHSGYRSSGSSSLKCSDYGSWNGVQASCKEITCRSFKEPEQGTSNMSESNIFHIGDTVTFHCNDYYKLVGESVITCDENGEWNNREPFCQEIICEKLLSALHGLWVYNEAGPARPGTRAELKCGNSYDIVSGPALICSQNGTWVKEQRADKNKPTIDENAYMPICTQKGECNKKVPLWSLLVGCICSFLIGAVMCTALSKFQSQRKFLNRSLNSLDKDNKDEQKPLMNTDNPKTCRQTDEQQQSNSNQTVQFINNFTANYSQKDNQTNHTHVNQSRPYKSAFDISDDNFTGGNNEDDGQPTPSKDPFPIQVANDQENDQIHPKGQHTANAQVGNGSAPFGSTVTTFGSVIAQPDSSVAQPSSSSTINANQRGGVYSQPSSDTDDLRALKILPSGSRQPIHEDDI